jgi:hypothetical protein
MNQVLLVKLWMRDCALCGQPIILCYKCAKQNFAMFEDGVFVPPMGLDQTGEIGDEPSETGGVLHADNR